MFTHTKTYVKPRSWVKPGLLSAWHIFSVLAPGLAQGRVKVKNRVGFL